ncbi:MAG: flavodoxin family protein [Oscillospiraceae bacterium]|nr:flavodoxin family protein [Oscillospiraceae bacterium]
MKVLLLNGSPNKDGCTFTALSEVGKALTKNGIETEWFQLGTKPVHGCIACRKCSELKACIFNDDICNDLAAKIREADGLVVGSPVYFSGPNGALCAVLDRVFYSSMGKFKHKPAACVVNCRRSGGTAAFERLNKYFTYAQMPVVSSQYWNVVHGFTPEHVEKDLEGLSVMRVLGNNMAWMLKCFNSGVPLPEKEEKRYMTNFHDGK